MQFRQSPQPLPQGSAPRARRSLTEKLTIVPTPSSRTLALIFCLGGGGEGGEGRAGICSIKLLPKDPDFILKSVDKFKSKGVLQNSGGCSKRQLEGEILGCNEGTASTAGELLCRKEPGNKPSGRCPPGVRTKGKH